MSTGDNRDTPQSPERAPVVGRVQVFVEDPELLRLVRDSDRQAATRAGSANLIEIAAGEWEPDLTGFDRRGHLGFLVLEGLLVRKVEMYGTSCAEVLGPPDVLWPWTQEYSSFGATDPETKWDVLEDTRLASLDPDFARAMGPWPEVTSTIIDRIASRIRSLAFQWAVGNVVGLERRLLDVLWHLADRWGRVTPEGVVVTLPLTHELLARIVGARRPSVTTALSRMRERGLIEKVEDGSWCLLGRPGEA